jgi:hypothetical protein
MLRHNRRLLRLDVSSNPLYHPLCGRRPVRFAVRDSSPDDDEALRSRWKDKRSFLRSSGGSGATVPLLAISPPSPASVQAGGLMSPPQSAPARNRYQADGGNRHQVDTTNARHPHHHHHHQYHPHNRLRNTFLLEWLQLEPVAAQADEVSAAIAERSSHIELLCDEEDSEEEDDERAASKGPYNICRILEENTSLVWLVMANANLHMNSATSAPADPLGKPKPRGKRGRRLARKAARERLEAVESNQVDAREDDDDEDEEETFTMDEELIADEDGEDQDAVKHTTQSYRFMRSLSRALARNGNLTSLDLSWNRLDAATIAPLAEALDNGRQANAGLSLLTTLVLRGNRLQDEGVAVLARSLLNNCTVTTLNLDTNRITDEVRPCVRRAPCLVCRVRANGRVCRASRRWGTWWRATRSWRSCRWSATASRARGCWPSGLPCGTTDPS